MAPEYAEFNDPEGKPTTELEKAEAIINKPWRKSTWKERLFKGAYYTGVFVASAAASVAAANAVSPRRSSGSGGWDPQPTYQMPVLRSNAPTQPYRPAFWEERSLRRSATITTISLTATTLFTGVTTDERRAERGVPRQPAAGRRLPL